MARLVTLIFTDRITGLGKEGDPIRACPQLWTPDGILVAQQDPQHPEKVHLDLSAVVSVEH